MNKSDVKIWDFINVKFIRSACFDEIFARAINREYNSLKKNAAARLFYKILLESSISEN